MTVKLRSLPTKKLSESKNLATNHPGTNPSELGDSWAKFTNFPEFKLALETIEKWYFEFSTWLQHQPILQKSISDLSSYYVFLYSSFDFLEMSWLACHVINIIASVGLLIGVFKSYWDMNFLHFMFNWANNIIYLIVCFRHLSLINSKETDPTDKEIPLAPLFKSENYLLLGISMLMTYTNPSLFKLIPFFLYSLFNVNITLFKPVWEDPILSRKFLPYLGKFEDFVCFTSSFIDIFNISIYLYEWFRYDSKGILIYIFIMAFRLETSEYLRAVVLMMVSLSYNSIEKLFPNRDLSYLKLFIERVEVLIPNNLSPLKFASKSRVKTSSVGTRVVSINFESLKVVDDT